MAIVRSAVRACAADVLLSHTLLHDSIPITDTLDVVAAGKAAGPMLRALSGALAGRIGTTVVARGGHPLPDVASVDAARAAMALAADARRSDRCLIVLLSGGASAMLALPADGLTLDDKIAATKLLLASGLPIAEMNAVRKHLSSIKGGRLAAAARRSVTFAISDVHAPIDNDPSVIGSGPTVGDASTFADALAAVRRARLMTAMPPPVQEHLLSGARGERDETIKVGDERLAGAAFVLAGSRRDAMAAARAEAHAHGYRVAMIDAPLVGDVEGAKNEFIARAHELARDLPRPFCVLAAGETTVSLPADDVIRRGGRNQEFALRAAAALPPFGAAVFASIGTDGIDGPTDAAGAIVDSTTLTRAATAGLDPATSLREHASYDFFSALNDLVVTGPTGTNVGDLQVLLVA